MERKECIVPVLLETEAHKDCLRHIPHREILNLSIVYKYIIDSKNGARVSILIQQGSEEELYEAALSNIKPVLLHIVEAIQGQPTEVLEEMAEAVNSMYVVTSLTGLEGASSILKPGVLSGLAEQLDGNLIILPSSIHECIVMLDDGRMDEEEVAELVRDANTSVVVESERLSDLPMYYNRETGSLSLLEDKEGDSVIIEKT